MAPAEAALVTGGSRGIGFAIASELLNAGHAVALVARDEARLRAAAAELHAGDGRGARVLALAQDLRAEGAAERVLDLAQRQLGRITILVNNAGTAPSARFEQTTDAQLDEVLDLHVRAPFRLIRALLPGLREHGDGCIVQVASTAGLRGFPFTAAYAAAKHAMVGMTRALHEELRASGASSALEGGPASGGSGGAAGSSPGTHRGVHCYAVCPGFVDTDITRQAAAAIARRGRRTAEQALAAFAAMNRCGRLQQPAEVARAVLQLCRERPEQPIHDLDLPPAAARGNP